MWRTARPTLIPKGKGVDRNDPRAYRPLGLLSALSKLFEGMLNKRLRRQRGGISPNQHGFRKAHSTISAIEGVMKVARNRSKRWCALELVDIKNVFNTAT
ncbi:hypothetical protein JTB14_028329 [Gonioctena quinquepunctata]|nr:hypothetical protein JTB14_028329 [Gonioctena quinquepunctata]